MNPTGVLEEYALDAERFADIGAGTGAMRPGLRRRVTACWRSSRRSSSAPPAWRCILPPWLEWVDDALPDLEHTRLLAPDTHVACYRRRAVGTWLTIPAKLYFAPGFSSFAY